MALLPAQDPGSPTRDGKQALVDTAAAQRPNAAPRTDATTPIAPAEAPDDDENAAPTLPDTHRKAPRLAASPGSPGGSAGIVSSSHSYRLGGLIGRGGMGEVVSARDEQIGRWVAIKRLRPEDATPEAIARFMREAQIQGRLDHPAIVPVHELWHDEYGHPFFVMKQLTGTTLADVLTRQASGDPEMTRRFPRSVLLRAFVDVCLALEFAHTRGVVHRDVKPPNIMLGDFGEVYVLDWGIAHLIADEASAAAMSGVTALEGGATAVGIVIGTPGYMPAEQVRGEADLDARVDVYALGCILFMLLTLEQLHPSGQAGLLSALQGGERRPSLRAPDRDIPPELDAVCVTATMLDRHDRFTSARELGDAVQRYLDGDRDLALRVTLARGELAAAYAAHSRGNSTKDRQTAIRAAARAIALDPRSSAAAELVGKLMLEPPSEIPDEVERELEALDDASMRVQGRLGTFSMLTYVAFFPLLYWAGFRDLGHMVAGLAVTAAIVAAAYVVSRTASMRVAYGCFIANLVLVMIIARISTPFLVAPGVAAITVIAYAAQARMGRAWVLFAVTLVAVLGPWIAELMGLLSPTTRVVGGNVHLSPSAAELDPTITMLALVLSVTGVLAMAAILPRALSLSRRDMQRSLQVQAWQLRQLVARSPDSGSQGRATAPQHGDR